jgi:uncharacterized protein YheU (UPF0270 family)
VTEDIDDTPVPVPWTDLSAEALRGVVEAFVLREGTDYGAHEFTLAEKVEHVLAQLRRGEAEIVYEARLGTVDILPIQRSARRRDR